MTPPQNLFFLFLFAPLPLFFKATNKRFSFVKIFKILEASKLPLFRWMSQSMRSKLRLAKEPKKSKSNSCFPKDSHLFCFVSLIEQPPCFEPIWLQFALRRSIGFFLYLQCFLPFPTLKPSILLTANNLFSRCSPIHPFSN